MSSPSTVARDEILSRMRRELGRPQPLFRGERAPVPGTPAAVTLAEGDAQALAEHFGTKLAAVSGSCEFVRRADAAERVVQAVRVWGDESSTSTDALGWAANELPLPGLSDRLNDAGFTIKIPKDLHDVACRADAARAPIGITGVDAAFASTGSMLVISGPGKPRATSLLPTHHLALVPISRIHPTFEAWLAVQRGAGRLELLVRESAQLVFITGPSKSADIELNLTLGVHGPRTVHAIVFDDTELA